MPAVEGPLRPLLPLLPAVLEPVALSRPDEDGRRPLEKSGSDEPADAEAPPALDPDGKELDEPEEPDDALALGNELEEPDDPDAPGMELDELEDDEDEDEELEEDELEDADGIDGVGMLVLDCVCVVDSQALSIRALRPMAITSLCCDIFMFDYSACHRQADDVDYLIRPLLQRIIALQLKRFQ